MKIVATESFQLSEYTGAPSSLLWLYIFILSCVYLSVFHRNTLVISQLKYIIPKKKKTNKKTKKKQQKSIPVGCVPSAAVAISCVCVWGGGVGGGGSACGDVSARGGCLLSEVYPSTQWGRQSPMDRQTPVKTVPFRNYCCGL